MPAPPDYRGRFAPSPTGPLHLGSLLAAWVSWLLARQAGGEWLIRIEDLDPPRERAGVAQHQLDTLAGFGLTSDRPVIWQSQRSEIYQAALEELLVTGSAFACHCSRTDLVASEGIHHCCVDALARVQTAIRLRVPMGTQVAFDDGLQHHYQQDVYSQIGDVVLRRADGYWAYQLAVVVDDAAQGITDVVRGADLLESTPRQILIQRALGLPQPRYLHLPLLVDAQGQKLSKSLAAVPIDASDPLPALHAIWAMLGQDISSLHGHTKIEPLLRAAIASFALEKLPKQPTISFAAPHNMSDSSAV